MAYPRVRQHTSVPLLLAVTLLAASPAQGTLLLGWLSSLLGRGGKAPAPVNTPPSWAPKTDAYDPRNKNW